MSTIQPDPETSSSARHAGLGRRDRIFSVLTVAAIAALFVSEASAATVHDLVTFSVTDFTSAFGQPVPTDPVTGSFTISFDSTMTYSDQTTGISLKNLNIPLDSAISFSYSPTGTSAGELVVGGLNDGAAFLSLNPSQNDFYLYINNFVTSPSFQQLGYTETSSDASNGFNAYFYSPQQSGGTFTITPLTSVPEPAAWTLLLAGLGGLGAALRSSRRRSGLPA
ncbi:MAG TPA: PEP-CTERM sorting domain-containing protein [Caulobacteraceae bacterium]|jgi:hypothetical protein